MDSSLVPFVDVSVYFSARHILKPQLMEYGASNINVLWIVRSGDARITAADRVWTLGAGDAFLITAAHRRTLFHCRQPMDFSAFGFDATLLKQFNLLQSLEAPALWQPSAMEFSTLGVLMGQLEEVYSTHKKDKIRHDGASRLLLRGLGLALFGACWQQLQVRKLVRVPSQQAISWLPSALEYLRRRPDTSVTDWARAVGFSVAQFRRIFHAGIGASPQAYLASYRLDQARTLLHTTDIPVAVIAEQLGIRSPQHFSAVFKNATGLTPSAYRRTLDSSNEERF